MSNFDIWKKRNNQAAWKKLHPSLPQYFLFIKIICSSSPQCNIKCLCVLISYNIQSLDLDFISALCLYSTLFHLRKFLADFVKGGHDYMGSLKNLSLQSCIVIRFWPQVWGNLLACTYILCTGLDLPAKQSSFLAYWPPYSQVGKESIVLGVPPTKPSSAQSSWREHQVSLMPRWKSEVFISFFPFRLFSVAVDFCFQTRNRIVS